MSDIENILIILSFDPVNKYLESEEKSTLLTGAEWPLIVLFFPLTEFVHKRTVSSFEADATISPNGLITTSLTAPLCPINLNGRVWGLKFQTKIFPSSLPVIACFL